MSTFYCSAYIPGMLTVSTTFGTGCIEVIRNAKIVDLATSTTYRTVAALPWEMNSGLFVLIS